MLHLTMFVELFIVVFGVKPFYGFLITAFTAIKGITVWGITAASIDIKQRPAGVGQILSLSDFLKSSGGFRRETFSTLITEEMF